MYFLILKSTLKLIGSDFQETLKTGRGLASFKEPNANTLRTNKRGTKFQLEIANLILCIFPLCIDFLHVDVQIPQQHKFNTVMPF